MWLLVLSLSIIILYSGKQLSGTPSYFLVSGGGGRKTHSSCLGGPCTFGQKEHLSLPLILPHISHTATTGSKGRGSWAEQSMWQLDNIMILLHNTVLQQTSTNYRKAEITILKSDKAEFELQSIKCDKVHFIMLNIKLMKLH